eukprot:5580520-Prymnesium_polylepis.2
MGVSERWPEGRVSGGIPAEGRVSKCACVQMCFRVQMCTLHDETRGMQGSMRVQVECGRGDRRGVRLP